MKIDFKSIFDKVIAVVFSMMLVVITLSIIIGVFNMFFILGEMVLHNELAHDYLRVISDVLTLFILIELSRSLVEYFNTHRLRLTFIVDAAIVFVLRELMIKLFEHKILPDEIIALSVLLFVLGAIRIGSVVVYQREKKMLEPANTAKK
ncbi:MAG TPA: phosphate-starvation-inducible PsiE family protein [Gammaproteobacteria bacterium]